MATVGAVVGALVGGTVGGVAFTAAGGLAAAATANRSAKAVRIAFFGKAHTASLVSLQG